MGKFSKKYYYNRWKVSFDSEYTLYDFITENELQEDEIVSVIQEDKDDDGEYEYSIIFKHKKNK